MKLLKLKLNNFRNYLHEKFEFCDNINIVAGDNGTGKTSLLEAIHYLSLSKSFRTHNNNEVIKHNDSYFQIFGNFLSSVQESVDVNMNYSKTEGKKIFYNKFEFKKKTDIIGKIPLVILSPNSQKITEGAPSLRRGFIDRILSQINSEYLNELLEFKKRLYQRNILLTRYRDQGKFVYDDYIESIDELLIQHAQKIQIIRTVFINEFNPVFKNIFTNLSHTYKDVEIKIIPSIKCDKNDFLKDYRDKLRLKFKIDINYNRTSSGPHADQIMFIFKHQDIRYSGSQGEHKIFLVALKLAEGVFIEKYLDEKVLFLLDDLFALLDKKHSMNIINKIGLENQTFITATDLSILKRSDFKIENYNHKLIQLPAGSA